MIGPVQYKSAKAALEQIAIVCTDNMDRSCDHRMALDFVRQVANDYLDDAQPTPDPFNRKQVEAVCRAVCKVEGLDPDDDTFGDGCDPAWTRYADAVAEVLAAQPPAAPVEDKRTLTETVADIRKMVAEHGGLMHEVELVKPGTPVAYVPLHPRLGPLWSDTYPSGSEFERSNNYPRMPLYSSGLAEADHHRSSAATDGAPPWWKILADNWRGRNGNTTTGDSVRNSCADELEKCAARHHSVSPQQPVSSGLAARAAELLSVKDGWGTGPALEAMAEKIGGVCAEVGAQNRTIREALELAARMEREPQTAREKFEQIITSLKYNGSDADSLTVGEIRRALP